MILLLVGAIIAGIVSQDSSNVQKISGDNSPSRNLPEWKEWRKTVGKDRSYLNASDEEEHALAFEKSLALVRENQLAYERGDVLYTLSLNLFADHTDEELSRLRISEESIKAQTEFISKLDDSTYDIDLTVNTNSLPTKWDWRVQSPVKFPVVENQGVCGGCYAFSALFAMEAQLAIHYNITTSLSKQYALDCSWHVGPEGFNHGCDGGLEIVIYDWLFANGKGVPETSTYPYRNENGVKPCPANASGRTYKIKGYRHGPDNEAILQENLFRNGPVACAIAASRKFRLYQSGIFHDDTCGRDVDHAVVPVGYGTENGMDFWILRNSWGRTWGNDGYGKLRRGTHECGFPWQTVVPTVIL